MPYIASDMKILTLINTFTVEPEDQDRLIEILNEATEKVMRNFPGFISASLHASLDRTRVMNYAQWRSAEDFWAATRRPEFQPHRRACSEIAVAEPYLYWVCATTEVSDEES